MTRGCFTDWILDQQEAVPLEERLAIEANEAAGEAEAEREAREAPVHPTPGVRSTVDLEDLHDDIPF